MFFGRLKVRYGEQKPLALIFQYRADKSVLIHSFPYMDDRDLLLSNRNENSRKRTRTSSVRKAYLVLTNRKSVNGVC